ncbi:hypothetical protein [Aquimarina pacifica]|uniref:hypothetical protein n=1 Tax=Aquimarina pacifica TaxID=1296415 RepID=UPI0004701CE3|nr:hypothetical protein [Aquimarina pacifica]
MKKKLEAELISIAHRILQLKDTTTLSQLQEESRLLYEKLTILNFSESHFAGPQPTIGQIKAVLDTAELNTVEQEIENEVAPLAPEVVENNIEGPAPIVETQEPTHVKEPEVPEERSEISEAPIVENKPELIIEEINARVSEDLFIRAQPQDNEDHSFSEPDTLTPVSDEDDTMDIQEDTQDVFEQDEVMLDQKNEEKPKSLNDQLKKEIHIGLNDRLAFIKYLFEGNALDYNRVLSQLNTLTTKSEAQTLITTMIKPDYHNWEGKEEYEERFMNAIFSKYDQ